MIYSIKWTLTSVLGAQGEQIVEIVPVCFSSDIQQLALLWLEYPKNYKLMVISLTLIA